MSKRLPIVLNYVFYTLRGGFLVRPLLITLLLGMLGATLSILETLFPAI
ncbi:MAG: hypothetical protein JWL77_4397, partial [Chthonomonadaceae bacterium]|nr:hypothetical protein [Chthonomonadaceae bacterium]